MLPQKSFFELVKKVKNNLSKLRHTRAQRFACRQCEAFQTFLFLLSKFKRKLRLLKYRDRLHPSFKFDFLLLK